MEYTYRLLCYMQVKQAESKETAMQKNIHPSYGAVIYRDIRTGDEMLTRSTLGREGEPPRIINVEVSRFSHAAYGGAEIQPLENGAVAKFRKRYGA